MFREIPKGKLLIIGGAEAREKEDLDISERMKGFEHFEILKELLNGSGRKKIEIITTASNEPEKMEKLYKHAFNHLGFKNIGFIDISNNIEARDQEMINRIHSAHAVLFTGGNQFRLSAILGNTKFLDAILEKYIHDKDFILAGTSAGASVMNTIMIFEGENNEALLKETVKISSGLGFIDGCLIDTHFVDRGRFGRLIQGVIMNPTCLGIGLGEDAALLITENNIAECKGSGMVVIVDGRNVGSTNIAFVENDEPLYVENLRVHILCHGCGFILNERKFLVSEDEIRKSLRRKSPKKKSSPRKKMITAGNGSSKKNNASKKKMSGRRKKQVARK
jgi:cyanophycinase